MTESQYLESLSKKLAKGMPKEVSAARVRELSAHLSESVRAYIELNEPEESAIRHAIADMGSTDVVAGEILRQHSGFASAMPHRLVRFVAPVLFLGIVIPFFAVSWVVWHPPIGEWINDVWSLCAILALAVFVRQIWRTRRWLVLPILPWMFLAIVTVYAVSLIQLPIQMPTNTNRAVAKEAMETGLKSLAPEKDALARWEAGKFPIGVGPVPRGEMNASYWLPLLPFPLQRQIGPRTFTLEYFPPDVAKAKWDQYGKEYALDLAHRESNLREIGQIASYRNSGPDYLAALPRMAVTASTTLGIVAVELILWNGIILAIAGLADKARNARFRRRLV